MGTAAVMWDGAGGWSQWWPIMDALARSPHDGVDPSRLAAQCRSAQAGDPDAFRAWVESVTPTVWRLAVRVLGHAADAEDVVQDVMIKAWQGLGQLRDPQASLAWVCQIARRSATDRLRSRQVRAPHSVDMEAPSARAAAARLADGSMTAEDLVANQEAQRILTAALSKLPDKHRLPLLLCDGDGMSGREAAAALGIAEGTLDSRLHRARAALRRTLKGMAVRGGWRWWS